MLNARYRGILYVLQRKVDMTQVLNYPLTPVPLSLKHVDGMMIHTSKSALLTYLKTKKARQPLMKLMFKSFMQHFFHLHEDLPANFGGVAKYLWRKILQRNGKLIHFVSDKWITPSVKECERQSRTANDVSYHIVGAAQKRPTNSVTALCVLVSKHHWWNSFFRLDQTMTMFHYSKEKLFSLIVEIFGINSCQYWTKL